MYEYLLDKIKEKYIIKKIIYDVNFLNHKEKMYKSLQKIKTNKKNIYYCYYTNIHNYPFPCDTEIASYHSYYDFEILHITKNTLLGVIKTTLIQDKYKNRYRFEINYYNIYGNIFFIFFLFPAFFYFCYIIICG